MTHADSNIVIGAFSEDHAERLTAISKRQLRYWDRTGFFTPTYANENRRVAYSRIYSFKDIASLRVLNMLRNQYSVPLQHLRKVAVKLSHMSDARWTATALYVLNKKVIFVEPDSKQHQEIVSGQYVMGIPLHIVVSDTKNAVKDLQTRAAKKIGKVGRARYVSHNSWVIAGTRIPIAVIKRFVEDGFSVNRILKEYPTLTAADIKAAIKHKGDSVAA